MRSGTIDIDFLGHAGFLIKSKGRVVVIDPYHVSDNLAKADVILISHGHSDHCSIKDIVKLSKPGTTIFCPVDCQSTLMKVKNIELHAVEIQDSIDLGFIKIDCVAAYTENKRHSKQEGWLGYVLTAGKNVIYFAGDTDHIPEMSRLSGYGKKGNNFIALLPVAGEVVMDSVSASKVVKLLNPSLAIPMSYGSGVYGNERDAQLFVDLCKQNGFNAMILPKI
ncbi:MAG: MBL fold metallo-hydrolase [Candidatus Pacearchaeota archaeon]